MSATVKEMIKDFKLEVLVEGDSDKKITVGDVNRPGLQLAGFYNYFDFERVQVMGNGEWSFLDGLNPALRLRRCQRFMKHDINCVIITRGLKPHEEMIQAARKEKRWILRTDLGSSKFISNLTIYLANALAPQVRVHAGLVDVHGIGCLITGDSGVGKSEATLELIRRGHRLVSDDAVDIKEVDGILRGYCPEITYGMMEVRGMGIIDVTALYGLSVTLPTKKIDLIIHLQRWEGEEEGAYDRLGIEEYESILGVDVRKIVLPVRSGRNLAIIIEAAAANHTYSKIAKMSPTDVIEQRVIENAAKEDYLNNL